MNNGAPESISRCEALPEDKRAEARNLARLLLSRDEHPDDAARERLLADERRRPRLEAFARASEAEGKLRRED